MVNSVMGMSLARHHAHDPLACFPGYALRRAASAMMADLGARLALVELRITDASVLLLIGERDDLTSTEIGRTLDIQRANMVPLLNRLEEAGLIARRPIDLKSQAIILTKTGRNRLGKVNEITKAFEADLLSRIPAAHRQHLLPALHALWE